jgi:phosphate-selective porin OprO/OprP
MKNTNNSRSLWQARGALAGLLMGITGAVAASMAAAAPEADPATKPTVEELLKRIEILERKLDAQQKQDGTAAREVAPSSSAISPQSAAAAQGGVPIQSAAPSQPSLSEQAAAGQTGVAEQQAASTTISNAQVFAGPSGFSIQSPSGANQIRFHGEFDFDGRFYNDDLTPEGSRSTWLIMRARPIVEGTFAQIFDFRFNPDFANGKAIIQDAFVAARFNPMFIVTAGKFKEPIGLERLQFSPNNRFVSLGLPSDIVPNRDLGLQVSGQLQYPSGTLTYQVGYFDGTNDGVSTDANPTPDIDTNDGKDWAARVFAEPFSKSKLEAVRGLGAGIAVGYVRQTGNASNTLLPSYKTETARSFFSYYTPTAPVSAGPVTGNPTIADGERLRLSPQAYYYYDSFGLLTEYVRESQQVSRTVGPNSDPFTRRATLKPYSWQVYATYLLTGEKATFGTVVPRRSFETAHPGWGAVELGVRVSQLQLDSETFTSEPGFAKSWFANPATQANSATAWSVGFNWYLTQNVEWVLDYTVTRFDGGATGADRNDESAFFTQFQVAF